LRAVRLERVEGRDPVLDRRPHLLAPEPGDVETEVSAAHAVPLPSHALSRESRLASGAVFAPRDAPRTEPAMTRPADDLKGMRVLVVGLARTGLAAVRFLAERGALVTANDRRTDRELADERVQLEALGARVVLGDHPEALFR